MISMLPTLRLPWQQIPVRDVRWSPLIPRPPARVHRCCWNCGRHGVTFCPETCLTRAQMMAGRT